MFTYLAGLATAAQLLDGGVLEGGEMPILHRRSDRERVDIRGPKVRQLHLLTGGKSMTQAQWDRQVHRQNKGWCTYIQPLY